MRTYSNFLLFEDVLENLPNTSPLMVQAAHDLMNPSVRIVEEDCGTLLGTIDSLTFESEGKVELATNNVISRDRIEYLLGEGRYAIHIRNSSSCISEGGICKKCYHASFLDQPVPELNSMVSIPTRLNYQTDIIVGTGNNNRFKTTQLYNDFDYALVFKNGVLLSTNITSFEDNLIIFNYVLSPGEMITIQYYREDSSPFLGYMAQTYSGGLLGMKPLPTLPPPLRFSLYKQNISDSLLTNLTEDLVAFKIVPSTYIDYIDRIHDKLEKLLYILYTYSVYSNIIL